MFGDAQPVVIEIKHLVKEFEREVSLWSTLKSWFASLFNNSQSSVREQHERTVHRVVDDLSFTVHQNEIVALLGHKYGHC